MEIKWSIVASVFCSFLLFSDVQTAMATKTPHGIAQGKAFGGNPHLNQNIHGDGGNYTAAAMTGAHSIVKPYGRAVVLHPSNESAAKKELTAVDHFTGVFDDSPALVLVPTAAEDYFMYDRVQGEVQHYRR